MFMMVTMSLYLIRLLQLLLNKMETANTNAESSRDSTYDNEYAELEMTQNDSKRSGSPSPGRGHVRGHVTSMSPPPSYSTSSQAQAASGRDTHQRAPNSRCLIIGAVVMGVVLVIHTALICFVMVKVIQLLGSTGR